MRSRGILALLVALVLVSIGVLSVAAQDGDEMPPAEITNDEGGVAIITGEVPYTVTFIPAFGRPSISVLLVDISAVIDRRQNEPDFVFSEDAQVLGQLTSNPNISPFSYVVNLPIVPRGEFRDLDNDDQEDIGVITMDIRIFTNMFGDAYYESDREYNAGLASSETSPDFDLRTEIVGGKVVVWSPDDQQGFPVGFGEDGRVFTDDDPVVRLPPGYTVVDMSSEPFTFDRSFNATVDLIEAEQSLQPADYSDLSYTEAFDALVEQMRQEYSFTEYKNIDFDGLYDEFAPRFAEAEANNDAAAFQRALADYIVSFPDGHVGPTIFPLTQQAFVQGTDSSPGIAIRELDDGRVIVNYLVEGSPADAEGIQLGAEIHAVDGVPIQEFLPMVNTFGNFSTDHNRRLQELRYGMRFPRGTQVELTYQNPDSNGRTTVMLDTISERESWLFSSTNNGARPSWAQPVEYEILPSGYGYVRINTFSRDPLLALRLWEEMIDTMNQQGVPGVVIDMRWNSGGFNLDLVYAGYFFQQEVVVGNDALYYPDEGDFVIDPDAIETINPPADGRFYGGDVAVLVSPSCASACEFFSYNMSLQDRAAIVGHYPTAGLGGNITQVILPDGLSMQFTIGRALDANGDIRLEGIGVVPTVRVPVVEETLFYEGDVVLDYAIDYLNSLNNIPSSDDIQESGAFELGDTLTGTLAEGERVRFTVQIPQDINEIDILFNDQPGFVVRLYVPGNDTPVLDPITEDAVISGAAGATVIVEIGGEGDTTGGDFAVTVRQAQPPEQVAPETTSEDSGSIAIGDTVEGTLAVGVRFQYTLEFTESTTIDISAVGATDAVDTYLRVYFDGEEVASLVNDDRATGQLDALLAGVDITAGQTVIIEVAGFGDGSVGDFMLTVTESE